MTPLTPLVLATRRGPAFYFYPSIRAVAAHMQLLPAPGEVNPPTSSRIILSLDHVAQPGSSGCLSGKGEKKKKERKESKSRRCNQLSGKLCIRRLNVKGGLLMVPPPAVTS